MAQLIVAAEVDGGSHERLSYDSDFDSPDSEETNHSDSDDSLLPVIGIAQKKASQESQPTQVGTLSTVSAPQPTDSFLTGSSSNGSTTNPVSLNGVPCSSGVLTPKTVDEKQPSTAKLSSQSSSSTTSRPPLCPTLPSTTSRPPLGPTLPSTASRPPLGPTLPSTTSRPPSGPTLPSTASRLPLCPTLPSTTSRPPLGPTLPSTTSRPPLGPTLPSAASRPPLCLTLPSTTSRLPLGPTLQQPSAPLSTTPQPSPKKESFHSGSLKTGSPGLSGITSSSPSTLMSSISPLKLTTSHHQKSVDETKRLFTKSRKLSKTIKEKSERRHKVKKI